MQNTIIGIAVLLFCCFPAFGDDCPPAGDQHKYIDTPIDFEHPEMDTYRLHFKLQNGFSHDKKTLILLHGGPGEGLGAFDLCPGDYCFSELADRYNIVTVDERGSACSILPPKSEEKFMTVLATVEDIEFLRKHLVGDSGSVTIFGISFWTVVGIIYAARHEQVLDRLVLEGSVRDYKYRRHVAHKANFDAMLEAKPEIKSQWLELESKLSAGKLKLTLDDFHEMVLLLGYGYRGIWKVMPLLISQLNVGEYTLWDKLSGASPMDRLTSAVSLKYIMCRELFDAEVTGMEGFCQEFGNESSSFPKYDSSDYTTFQTPTLLITGRWDSSVPASYNSAVISQQIAHSRNFEIPFAGHGVMWERRACDIGLIASFLDKGITPELDQVFQSDVCQRE